MIKVVKFGGSSLASAEQFAKVGKIIHADKERRYVVPSAPGKRNSKDTKVTDMLYACYDLVEKDEDFRVMLMKIKDRYDTIINGLNLKLSLEEEFKKISENFKNKAGVDYAASRGEYLNGIIMEINGKDMAQGDRTPNELTSYVSDNLRGDPGTTCVLKLERPTADSTYIPMELKITRGTIRTNPVPYYGMVDKNIGYIAISTFAIEGCSKDIKKALIELKQQGATSIVLDLRGNGGGLLSEAVNVVNFFVPKGKEIVVTKGKIKQAGSTYKTSNEPIDMEIPLTVLVDGATASAAEIVSGSLQDLDRAVIVGNRTYGKGLVQVPRELPYNSSMKVTTAKYYIPSGRCIQAIDYAKRNADGSVARIPDSLTTVFHTAAGREVRDGGGIRPDVEVKAERFPNIMFYLLNDDMIFDYATQYCIKHPNIGEVKDFSVTDADYDDFKQMLKKRNFTYDRQSEKSLKNLKEIAEFEGYMEGASEEFAALEKKLTHNLDHELNRFSKQIRKAIAEEIVKRHYFQRGVILERMKDDADLTKAIETLKDKEGYTKILSVPADK